MNESKINELGISLITKLIKKKPINQKSPDAKKEELLIGEKCIGTFQIPKIDVMRYFREDTFGDTIMVGAHLKDEDVELGLSDYQSLRDLATELLINHGYGRTADVKYIEDKIWQWIVDCYLNKKCEPNLYNYIKQNYASDKRWKEYTFPLSGVVIEKEFRIGNCLIHHHSIDYFHKKFDECSIGGHLKESNRDNFIEMHKSFIDRPIISATVHGVDSKALSSAKLEINLSISAIKCFLLNESLKSECALFDVDGLYDVAMKNYFSTALNGEDFTMHLEASAKTSPIPIDNKKLKELNSYGLEQISQFIKKRGELESHEVFTTSILSLGEAFSTTNLYLRIVRLISYFENIVIPKANPVGKGQTFILKNIIPKILPEEKNLAPTINRIYDCRDKFLHNKVELTIIVHDLFLIQKLAITMLLYLIENAHEFDSLIDIQEHFGIKIIEKTKKIKVSTANNRS